MTSISSLSRAAFPRRIAASFAALVLALGLAGTADAARIAKQRVIAPDRMPALQSLQAVSVLPQDGIGLFVVDPRLAPAPNVTAGLATNPAITGGTFAGGAAVGLAGALIGSAIVDGQWQVLRDRSRDIVYALGDAGDWSAAQDGWQDAIAQRIGDSGLVAGDVVRRGAASTDEEAARSTQCAQPDECMVVLGNWGLSADATRFEARAIVMIWSAAPRKPGKKVRSLPDFYNTLVYQSAPLALPEKSDADRTALEAAARDAYARNGVEALVKQANASRDAKARRARKEASRLVADHRQRMRDAAKPEWTERAQTIRRAQLWGERNGARMREELLVARDEIAAMLALELTAEGQRAKPTGKFKMRHLRAVATTMQPGTRERVYLNDGTLLSRVSGDEATTAWNAVYGAAVFGVE